MPTFFTITFFDKTKPKNKEMTVAGAVAPPTLASALNNAKGIERDMAVLGMLVREKIFLYR